MHTCGHDLLQRGLAAVAVGTVLIKLDKELETGKRCLTLETDSSHPEERTGEGGRRGERTRFPNQRKTTTAAKPHLKA